MSEPAAQLPTSSRNTPWALYQQDLSKSGFNYDAAQEDAVRHLQRLYDDLLAKPSRSERVQRKIKRVLTGKSSVQPVQGLYFWGGVGRGKTYLVDTFYNTLPLTRKWRVHFHHFMQHVHQKLTLLKGRANPLTLIARDVAEEARVICFDEFFVQDIADAMILGTLFEELFKLGVVLVATSNIKPDDLYRNGLQRARFLPAIELIKAHCQVVNVDSGIDYRLRTLEKADVYHWPLNDATEQKMLTCFYELTKTNQAQQEQQTQPVALKINQRTIYARFVASNVAFFDFTELCGGPRSTFDYIEIARTYPTVLLSNVVVMGKNADDTARRFIALVDEFYERKVKLVMSGETALVDLYQGERLAFEFKRCLSRLLEMQSRDYLALSHNI